VTAPRRWRAPALVVAVAGLAIALAGCFDVRSPDLFLLTRTGQGQKLTLLVNDAGTIACNGAKAKPISNTTLIAARDLADDLAADAGKKLTIPPGTGTVYYFTIKLQQGTVAFPDRAAGGRQELGRAELFTAQAAQQNCGLSG
jgi:hypothetical protein